MAWDHFLERCGVIAELAANYPLPRTSPNATPVADILKAFSLNCLIGGTRFAHGRRLQDDEAVAKITGMHRGRLCGRYELLLIPAKMVLSGRRKIVKLAVGGKFASFLKQACQRLEQWLSRTAQHLTLTMGKSTPWLLFDPTQATS